MLKGSCHCGRIAFDVEGEPTAAVNVRCLEGIDLSTVKRIPFDGFHK